jgi:hypothetical protein
MPRIGSGPGAITRAAALLCAAVLLLTRQSGAQGDTSSSGHGPRLSVVGSLGNARDSGNNLADYSLAVGLEIGRFELRGRLGSLVFYGGCDAIVPTKCGIGGGTYGEGQIALHLFPTPRGVGAWIAAAGFGAMTNRSTSFVTGSLGRDFSLGRHGLVRLEVYGRHLFDDAYRQLWGEPHRQVGLRVGLGLWTFLNNL